MRACPHCGDPLPCARCDAPLELDAELMARPVADGVLGDAPLPSQLGATDQASALASELARPAPRRRSATRTMAPEPGDVARERRRRALVATAGRTALAVALAWLTASVLWLGGHADPAAVIDGAAYELGRGWEPSPLALGGLIERLAPLALAPVAVAAVAYWRRSRAIALGAAWWVGHAAAWLHHAPDWNAMAYHWPRLASTRELGAVVMIGCVVVVVWATLSGREP